MASALSSSEHGLWNTLKSWFRVVVGSSPPRTALLLFAVTIGAFTALLCMPFASTSGRPAHFVDALFVATSAVTVTGLTPVNTSEHWSTAGEVVILAGIQVGGLGIITTAVLLSISITKSLGLRTQLVAQEGMSTGRLGETGSLIRNVVVCSIVAQAILAAILIPRLMVLEEDPAQGAWHGLFYAISAFNNAGFTVHVDGLNSLGNDPLVLWTIMAGVFVGSLGFPVLVMLWAAKWHIRRWNLHTKLTMQVTLLLLGFGTIVYAILEWNNTATLGEMSVVEKMQNALFASVNMRSGGFSVVESNAESAETMLVSDALMFAGGGSASTAGGIKVTTIAIIWLAFVAEAKGREEYIAHGRTIPSSAIRVAVSVVAMGLTLVLLSTLALMFISGLDMGRPLYESISAFGTVGLSSGLVEELPPSGLIVLSVLMFAGRIGVITFAAALAVRQRTKIRYRYPESRPMIG